MRHGDEEGVVEEEEGEGQRPRTLSWGGHAKFGPFTVTFIIGSNLPNRSVCFLSLASNPFLFQV